MSCLLLAGALSAPVAIAGAGDEVATSSAATAAATLPAADAAPVTALNSPWRRTNRGWEKMTDWPETNAAPPEPQPRPCFHPGLLAVFLLLASLGALLAGEKDPAPTSAAK